MFKTFQCTVNLANYEKLQLTIRTVRDDFRSTGEETATVTTMSSTTTDGWLHKMQCNDTPLVDHEGGMNAYFMEMLVSKRFLLTELRNWTATDSMCFVAENASPSFQ